jgi:hypothetical protein
MLGSNVRLLPQLLLRLRLQVSADTLAALLLLLLLSELLGLRPSRPAKNVGLIAGG